MAAAARESRSRGGRSGTRKSFRQPRALTVTIVDERGRRLRAPGLAAWLRRVAPARARGSVTIAVVSDARMRTLNRAFRGKDYATDVLSFPSLVSVTGTLRPPSARQRDRLILNPYPLIPTGFLGDIVIARGVARRQASEAGHSPTVELRILALHGLLHLLGYDHERDNGRMRRVERRLRRKGGLREGLIERATE